MPQIYTRGKFTLNYNFGQNTNLDTFLIETLCKTDKYKFKISDNKVTIKANGYPYLKDILKGILGEGILIPLRFLLPNSEVLETTIGIHSETTKLSNLALPITVLFSIVYGMYYIGKIILDFKGARKRLNELEDIIRFYNPTE